MMATATFKKPRTSIEAVPQLATLPERVAVVEIKVQTIEIKIDDLKGDVKEMHDCLDRTRDGIMEQLKSMSDEAERAHQALGTKISSLEKFKEKWTYMAIGAAGILGFASGHLTTLLKALA